MDIVRFLAHAGEYHPDPAPSSQNWAMILWTVIWFGFYVVVALVLARIVAKPPKDHEQAAKKKPAK